MLTTAVRHAQPESRYNHDVPHEYTDSSEYSADLTYRWWYERRWGDGPLLCWVGLNPGTGDTDGKPRPTLRKVVTWAKEWQLDGVLVVNLFAYRTTNPRALQAASVDIVGERNDEVLRCATSTAAKTLAAWGSHGRLGGRGAIVTPMLDSPICLGTTRHREPRHPLYVPQAVACQREGTTGLPRAWDHLVVHDRARG